MNKLQMTFFVYQLFRYCTQNIIFSVICWQHKFLISNYLFNIHHTAIEGEMVSLATPLLLQYGKSLAFVIVQLIALNSLDTTCNKSKFKQKIKRFLLYKNSNVLSGKFSRKTFVETQS